MIIKRLYNSLNYRFWNLIHWHFPFHWAKHIYRQELGKTVDFSNPRDLNDKIQWLEFFTDTTLWSRLADKYRVRQYVVERMGDDDILIPLLGKWNTAEEIDFDALPDKFVIKPNNGSYDCVIVTDKYNYDLEEIRKKMDKSLHTKFGLGNAEPHYLRITPCIIAEQHLETSSPLGLIDYKIWCFNGKAFLIFVCLNRDNVTHHASFMTYDLEWNRHPEFISDSFKSDASCPRPLNLERMIEIAETLSQGLPQCRVDLYNIEGKIYFGEMTLTSNYGMMPYFTQEVLDKMGELCHLPIPSRTESFKCFLRRYIPYF